MNVNRTERILRMLRLGVAGIFAATATSLLQGETRLTATTGNSSRFEIHLDNDRSVAGLQFVLRSSRDIVLQEIHRSGRSSSGSWMVASNRLNDSTLSVVIVSTDLSYFPVGGGVIAEVTMSKQPTSAVESCVRFSNVVGSDPDAHRIEVSANNLNFNSHDSSSTINSSDFSLGQNYPNPFNPSTRLNYQLQKAAQVRLSVFDITGREISRVVDQYQNEGNYSVTWSSTENRSLQLPSGAYFARLQVGDNVVTRKMLLTK